MTPPAQKDSSWRIRTRMPDPFSQFVAFVVHNLPFLVRFAFLCSRARETLGPRARGSAQLIDLKHEDASRITFHVLRFIHHVSRIPSHPLPPSPPPGSLAFPNLCLRRRDRIAVAH